MDTFTLSSQAHAALASLTTQLASLESQQQTLLASIQITTSALGQLPAYNRIAPTFEAIPAYTRKLERLKKAMVLQQEEVAGLKRRAAEVRERRRENIERMRERRREEGERDRTVLRARVGAEETPETSGVEEARQPVKVVKKRKKVRKVEM